MKGQDAVVKRVRSIEIGKQAKKELQSLPEPIRNQFLVALENVSWGLDPGLRVTHLTTVDKGVIELKINGRPAYRLIYTVKLPGKVVVLVARSKTTEGQDKKLLEVAASRLKDRQ